MYFPFTIKCLKTVRKKDYTIPNLNLNIALKTKLLPICKSLDSVIIEHFFIILSSQVGK